jgi:hypothetical protein
MAKSDMDKLREWLEEREAAMADGIARESDQLMAHTLSSGREAVKGSLRKIDELQAEKEQNDGQE